MTKENPEPLSQENMENAAAENIDISDSAQNSEKSEETATQSGGSESDALAAEKEKFLRIYSEFENYKRRTAKERLDPLQTASKDIILQLLPVLDDMERAFKMLENQNDEVKKELEGFKLIHKKLFANLENKGLKAMDALHQPFDVELHEAITKIPAPTEDLKGKVLDEIEKGYLLYDHVIRYAKVVVGE